MLNAKWMKSAIALGMLAIGTFFGCIANQAPTAGELDPPLDILGTVTIVDPAHELNRWIAPWPQATPDSLLLGDFAPIEAGNTWIYHRSTRILNMPNGSTTDTEFVASLIFHILKIQATDSGRLLHIRIEKNNLAMRCALTRDGKAWNWDEAMAPDGDAVVEKQFLERGDVFFGLEKDGTWKPVQGQLAFLFHRFPRTQILPNPAADSQTIRSYFTYDSSNYMVFRRGLGMEARDSLDGSKAQQTQTRWKIVSFNGNTLNDSLDKELTRPFSPKDPGTGNVTLQDVAAGLSSGFCADEASEPTPDSAVDLSAFTEIRAGNEWEYLYTAFPFPSPHPGAASEFYSDRQGTAAVSIEETLQMGPCTLFYLREKDSLYTGTKYPIGKPAEALPALVNTFLSIGIKKGTQVYRWHFEGDGWSPEPEATGKSSQGTWIFTSSLSPVGVGQTDSSPPNIVYPLVFERSLLQRTIGSKTYLVYTDLHDGLIKGYRTAQGIGLIYEVDGGMTPQGDLIKYHLLELFRYNGEIFDPEVYQRFNQLKP